MRNNLCHSERLLSSAQMLCARCDHERGTTPWEPSNNNPSRTQIRKIWSRTNQALLAGNVPANPLGCLARHQPCLTILEKSPFGTVAETVSHEVVLTSRCHGISFLHEVSWSQATDCPTWQRRRSLTFHELPIASVPLSLAASQGNRQKSRFGKR